MSQLPAILTALAGVLTGAAALARQFRHEQLVAERLREHEIKHGTPG